MQRSHPMAALVVVAALGALTCGQSKQTEQAGREMRERAVQRLTSLGDEQHVKVAVLRAHDECFRRTTKNGHTDEDAYDTCIDGKVRVAINAPGEPPATTPAQ